MFRCSPDTLSLCTRHNMNFQRLRLSVQPHAAVIHRRSSSSVSSSHISAALGRNQGRRRRINPTQNAIRLLHLLTMTHRQLTRLTTHRSTLRRARCDTTVSEQTTNSHGYFCMSRNEYDVRQIFHELVLSHSALLIRWKVVKPDDHSTHCIPQRAH